MEYDSLKDFYSKLMEETENALKKAMERGKNLAYMYIKTHWYNKHPNGLNDDTPNSYKRTYELLESLDIEYKIYKNGNMEATLFIRDDVKHSLSNSWNREQVSFERLYQWFTDEEYYGEDDILEHVNESYFEAGKALKIIQDTLRKSGFDIK